MKEGPNHQARPFQASPVVRHPTPTFLNAPPPLPSPTPIPTPTHQTTTPHQAAATGSTTESKRAAFTAATFDNTADFFTRLCAESSALAFDLSELANGSVTRLVGGWVGG